MSNNKDIPNNDPEKKMDTSADSNDQKVAPSTVNEQDPLTHVQCSRIPSDYTRQKPVSVFVGSERSQYFVHKSLLAANSPFFRTMFKDCWDGKKEEIEINDIQSDGFEIVLDWMYSGHLPDRVKTYDKDTSSLWRVSLNAYKAADVLMIDKLQNDLIANEADLLSKHTLSWNFDRLQSVYDDGLYHTKYYTFVLKSATSNMMSNLQQPSEKWEKEIKIIQETPQLLVDLLRSTRDWARKPWKNFLKEDLSEFFIKEEDSPSLAS